METTHKTTPTELLRFFNIRQEDKKYTPKSIDDYMEYVKSNFGKEINATKVSSICKKLENEGLLFDIGKKGRLPFFNQLYMNLQFDERIAIYGGYDFLYYGFSAIRDAFKNSILPINVQKSNKDLDIGTCIIQEKNLILTAKHCVDGMKNIEIRHNGNIIKANKFFMPKNDKYDFAWIETEDDLNVKTLMWDNGNILDDVLTLGYPPISGFDSLQFAETGTISSVIKASAGEIVAEGESYLDRGDYFLINARVKGGNSGGPVINKYGYCVGMLTQIPFDNVDPNRIDIMGFGVAIQTKFIHKVMSNQDNVIEYEAENSPNGFKIGKIVD